ncbi:hypothetical protein F0726_01564 [Acidithiobacillus caldus]|nr:hypothetical protein F0726_01564 [Acidithiobacillus caldus]
MRQIFFSLTVFGTSPGKWRLAPPAPECVQRRW